MLSSAGLEPEPARVCDPLVLTGKPTALGKRELRACLTARVRFWDLRSLCFPVLTPRSQPWVTASPEPPHVWERKALRAWGGFHVREGVQIASNGFPSTIALSAFLPSDSGCLALRRQPNLSFFAFSANLVRVTLPLRVRDDPGKSGWKGLWWGSLGSEPTRQPRRLAYAGPRLFCPCTQDESSNSLLTKNVPSFLALCSFGFLCFVIFEAYPGGLTRT